MKFCWKFKKIIEEQIFKNIIKFGKTYSKIVDKLLKNWENLLINTELSQKWDKQCKLLISENYR